MLRGIVHLGSLSLAFAAHLHFSRAPPYHSLRAAQIIKIFYFIII